jgi:hypothetical protein
MSCCDYNCTDGQNCPIRQACELPVDGDKQTPYMMRDFLGVLALVAVFAVPLAYLGPTIDNRAEWQESQALKDAQNREQSELRRDMAAAELCREQHGESLVRWTEAGQLVCVPRGYIKRKTQ